MTIEPLRARACHATKMKKGWSNRNARECHERVIGLRDPAPHA